MTTQSQDAIVGEMSLLSDSMLSARSRIIQSPERIKRNIVTMSTTALEDKKAVNTNAAKTRDLHAKIDILVQAEKVRGFPKPSYIIMTFGPGRPHLYRSHRSSTQGEIISGGFSPGPN